VSDLLTILQHGDSAFPSGSFAFSNGIEALSAMDAALCGADLQDVVTMFLRHRWATSDRIAVALSHRASGDLYRIGEIDREVEAATLSEPLRSGSARNGNALLAAHLRLRTPGADEMRTLIDSGDAHGHLPVVQGSLWRAVGMNEADALAVSGYSTAAGLISAAVRLGHIGAVEAQQILTAVLPTVIDLSKPVPLDAQIESFMPWVEAATSRHARAHLRLFAN
jgi:urease accessory protein